MKEEFLKEIRKQLDEGVLGRTKFIQETKERFKIKSLKPRERPKKEK
jgi:hypothetical protein